MAVELAKQGLDLGIVTRGHGAMLEFYLDILGLPVSRVAEGRIGEIHYLAVGSSVLKLIRPAAVPDVVGPSGTLTEATGLRSFTLRIANLDDVLSDCERMGIRVVVPKESLPGCRESVATVADPDGNLIELHESHEDG